MITPTPASRPAFSSSTPAHFHHILVPLDGSELAELALPLAAAFAMQAGPEGKITLLGVDPHSYTAYSRGGAFELPPEAHAELSSYLTRIEADMRTRVPQVKQVLVNGDPATAIVDLAAERGADAIILVTHARAGLGKFIHGSVAERVLHGATVPVIILKKRQKPLLTKPLQLLVPLDGSPVAESVLPLVQLLAQQLSASVTLLRSLDLPDLKATGRGRAGAATASIRASIPAARKEATEYLTQIQQKLAAQGITTHLLVTEEEAAEDISKAATLLEREQKTVLIAMSTHGRSGLTRWLYGSVTGLLLHLTDAPLLVIRAR